MSNAQFTINVPQEVLDAQHMDEAAFAKELPLLVAVKLYELGRLSSRRAAELAGLSRIEFLEALGRYHAFPLQGELTDLESSRD